MGSILRHITPLVINSLGAGDTNTHTRARTRTETILRNQTHAGCCQRAPGLKIRNPLVFHLPACRKTCHAKTVLLKSVGRSMLAYEYFTCIHKYLTATYTLFVHQQDTSVMARPVPIKPAQF